MAEKFVGFYWTLPINWLGFRDVPKDAASAAAMSTTIRYQRAVVLNEVSQRHGELVEESAFIDVQPDRPTVALREAVTRAANVAMERSATLLIVDFGVETLWRRLNWLEDSLSSLRVRFELLRPVRVMLDGKPFEPQAHFKMRRREGVEKKLQLRTDAEEGFRSAVQRIGLEGESSYPKISKWLNDQGIKTPTGLQWSAENVRKVIKRGKYQL